ncbi:sulfite exporter TauE/SafE family protein [Helicobacter cappadocius]|uniref:Probable membrane transporter protein n=1 Tax=Helicobacter cappadocius TaxID=3063998 RepID=A0AA90T5A9_9HELI|nr:MULTISPECIES: sulfite exporter TauE/SafE family protein [unclassified Helicobacter]MDO7253342.1 sulfite exporter TauE/SafE family protein [Helicobacter sp. faydin-H75]MDP2539228.1 sulfite exporter TauE/SafE family protein [Helicobacter sp. faydin-H76]
MELDTLIQSGTHLDILIYICVGLISGIAAGFFGIGGGTIIVPLMLVLKYPMQHAIGISVMQMIFSSVFGSFINYKKGLLIVKDGIYAGIGGLIGASFSGIVLGNVSSETLKILFLCITFYSFIKYAFKVKSSVNNNPPATSPLQRNLILILAGALTGVFAISLGIGGGLLMVPILGYYLGYQSKQAVPASLFFVIFASISGTISLHNQNVIDTAVLYAGFYIGIASMMGVWIGIKLIEISSGKIHRIALLSIYMLSMLVTAYKLITG